MEKDSVFENIRVPIIGAIYKDPFEGLEKHSDKIDECVMEMKKCVYSYIDREYGRARKHTKRVREIEHQADLIKANIRTHLPKFVFLPISKRDFHLLIHDSDSILDYAEDVAVLLSFRETEIPDELGRDFRMLTDKILECVEAYQKVMSSMRDLLEASFSGKEREKAKDFIKEIHLLEHESDEIEYEITKKLFNMSSDVMDPISVMHLLKVVDRMGQIANKAENAGDRVRSMLAK